MPDTVPPAVDPGVIILLNGTSSSGKTSLVRALQDTLDLPLLDAGIDRFLWMLPKRYLNPPLWDDVLGRATEAGVTGQRLMSGMHHAIAALARTGNHVVADHVLVDRRWLQECACLFCDLPAYLIAVRCPLDVLEQREQQRQDRLWVRPVLSSTWCMRTASMTWKSILALTALRSAHSRSLIWCVRGARRRPSAGWRHVQPGEWNSPADSTKAPQRLTSDFPSG